MKNMGKQNGN
jgi:hypothetical protein